MTTRYRRAPSPEPVLAAILVLLWVGFAIAIPNFRDPQNYLDLTKYLVEIGIVGLAMTYVIITGGIDLSVGSVVGLSAVCLGLSWQELSLSVWAAVLVAILAGAAAGLANGGFIVGLRIPPLIATLGTMAALRGVALGVTQGRSVAGFPEGFAALGRGFYSVAGLDIPAQFALLLLLAVLAGVVLARTRFGRYVYAIGLNEPGARYAALPVDMSKLLIYTACGAAAGLAGAIATSRFQTAKPDLGISFELDVITACVVGGVSIYGGRGTILGTMLGLFFVGSLRRGLTFLEVKGEVQDIVVGAVLVLAVFVHQVLVPAVMNLLEQRRTAKEGAS